MRYFGSKTSTLVSLGQLVASRIPSGSFCDPFGGIGTVSSYFRARGYRVVAGDTLRFAHYFQTARLHYSRVPRLLTLRRHLGLRSSDDVFEVLNTAARKDGWLVAEYARSRRFFTLENARRIEACRGLLAKWGSLGLLSYEERAYLLASLIDSMDRVANTAGTYYAYLKAWDRKALRDFKFRPLSPSVGPKGRSYQCDARTLVGKQNWDVLYLDPPYNSRSYVGYYHLPETLALGAQPLVRGASGVPVEPGPPSDFSSPPRVRDALETLLAKARCRLMVLHYTDNGLLDCDYLRARLGLQGPMSEHVIEAKSYTVSSRRRLCQHRVFLVEHG